MPLAAFRREPRAIGQARDPRAPSFTRPRIAPLPRVEPARVNRSNGPCIVARTRNSSAWLVLWGGLLYLALRPIAAVERALDVLLAPLGVVAQLGAPFTLVEARGVAAAERELARSAQREAAEGAETLERLAARALPRDPELLRRRHFLPAEVVDRPAKDECWLVVRRLVAIERGAPVVCGDVYAGRVLEVRPGSETLARVQLVTAASFRVGAEVRGEEPVYLTVGGVRAPRRGSEPRVVRLAVHQPSSDAGVGALVRVHELFPDADDSGGLAEGFRLGELRRADEREPPWVEPELDYLDGLFQLAIVVPETTDALDTRAAPALEDGQWLAAHALTAGDPAPWRSTLKIGLGRAQGLSAGAAVTGAGAHLVGRVIHAGVTTSDVALLADPGLMLTAVARLEGQEEPRILGRLVALGRGARGTIRMRWYVRVPLELAAAGASGTVHARLFTGSGDAGLPAGLLLGDAELPAAVHAGEEHELALDPGLDPSGVRTLFVRHEHAGARP